MTKREDSPWPRILATALMGFLLMVLSTTLFAWLSVGALKLQPGVVMVVSAGFRLPLLASGSLAVVLGYMGDLVGGGVVGLQVLANVIVACACALAQRKLEINSWPFQMASVGVMTLVTQIVNIGGVMLVNRGQLVPLGLPTILLSQSLLSALTAPVFFGILDGLVGAIAHVWPVRNQAGS